MKLSFEGVQGIDGQASDSVEQISQQLKIAQLDKIPRETQPNQQLASFDQLVMVPPHKISQEYQISFQNGFLQEHSTSFKMQLQNYMELVRNCICQQNLTHVFPPLSQNPIPINVSALLEGHPHLVSTSARSQLLTGLKNQEKLEEFLSYVGGVCNGGDIAAELVHLGVQILEKFSRHHALQPDYQEILTAGQLFSIKRGEHIYDSKVYKFINLSFIGEIHESERSTLLAALEAFLKYYHTTIWLVICQYFENPFFQKSEKQLFLMRDEEGDLKRSIFSISFEDDFQLEEDSVDIFRLSPYKRIKE